MTHWPGMPTDPLTQRRRLAGAVVLGTIVLLALSLRLSLVRGARDHGQIALLLSIMSGAMHVWRVRDPSGWSGWTVLQVTFLCVALWFLAQRITG